MRPISRTRKIEKILANTTAINPPAGFTSLYNGKDLSGWRGGDTLDPRKYAAMAEEARAKQDADWTADMLKHWSADGDELVGQYPRDLVGRKGLEAVSRRVQAQLMAEGQKPLVGEGELEKGPQVRGGEAVQR